MSNLQEQGLANNACITCRKQKRRCSKEIPQCFFCRKNRRNCDYTFIGSGSNKDRSSDSSSLTGSSPWTLMGEPSISETSALDPMSTLFLDPAVYQYGKYLGTITDPGLPSEFLGSLGTPTQVRHEVDIYFNSVHSFFPIVSKLRMYKNLSDSTIKHGSDTTLLLITMQLHTQPNTESPRSELYRLVKACYNYVETLNILSIKVLQAGLLIALYEISNAIYPAAYLMVGHCARLGHAMGIHQMNDAPQLLSQPSTWVELEERRRTWWAVMILDRYVNVGGKHHPFACENACPDDLLPADDKYWDRGEITVVEPLAVRANTTLQASPYTRTCQAAHVLSRILGHLNDRTADVDFRYQEAMQLHRTAQALAHTLSSEIEQLMENEYEQTVHLALYPSMGLCYSALLILYDRYCCVSITGTTDNAEMQKLALSSLQEVSTAVFRFATNIRSSMELGGSLRISPLVMDCLYQAAANFIWRNRETSNANYLVMTREIQDVLRLLGTQWRAPVDYLAILRVSESEGCC